MRATDEQPTSVVPNDDRMVDLTDDPPLLSEQSVDDTDQGWGDWPGSNDDRLLAERPPHWD